MSEERMRQRLTALRGVKLPPHQPSMDSFSTTLPASTMLHDGHPSFSKRWWPPRWWQHVQRIPLHLVRGIYSRLPTRKTILAFLCFVVSVVLFVGWWFRLYPGGDSVGTESAGLESDEVLEIDKSLEGLVWTDPNGLNKTDDELHPLIHSNLDAECTKEYLARNAERVMVATNRHTFLRYSTDEWDQGVPVQDSQHVQTFLEHPSQQHVFCASTVDSDRIQTHHNYSYLIVIRRSTPPSLDAPENEAPSTSSTFLTLVQPIYTISNTSIDGTSLDMKAPVAYKERARHCLVPAAPSKPRPAASRSKQPPSPPPQAAVALPPANVHQYETHVIVHYFNLNHTLDHLSLFDEEAVCVQHYARIYEGYWLCP